MDGKHHAALVAAADEHHIGDGSDLDDSRRANGWTSPVPRRSARDYPVLGWLACVGLRSSPTRASRASIRR
jgi:hypothetical protein